MHELSIVASLFEILEEKAKEKSALKIITVKLGVGKLAGVVPEFLEDAFNIYKKDTMASEASLEIAEIPLKIHCGTCHSEFLLEEFIFICPKCGSRELKILEGTDLFLERIIVEA